MPWPKLKELKYEWPALADATPEEFRYACRANGHKIPDVGVIERVLLKHTGIKEVGVCPRSLAGQKVLYAHVCMKPGQTMTEQTILDLRLIAENYLPAYMRPMRYKEIRYFPRRRDYPELIDHHKLGAWKIKTLNRESRKTPTDRKKRDFEERIDLELLDPVNSVHYEGSLTRVRTIRMWSTDSIFFDVSHVVAGRRHTATFWTDSKKTIDELEVKPRGAHLVVEGKLRSLTVGGKLPVNVIEVTSLQEVSIWKSARVDDLDEVLGAIF